MSFPNWFSDQAIKFFERNLPSTELRVLQIGTYTGDATMWLLDNKNIEYIHDVDTWEGSDEPAHHEMDFWDVFTYYVSRVKTHLDKVSFNKMTSDAFFSHAKDTYNFIYIDGDHTAVQTALDAFNAWRLLESGGIMAFDDYLWTAVPDDYERPRRAVDAFLAVCKDKYDIIDIGYQVWIRKH